MELHCDDRPRTLPCRALKKMNEIGVDEKVKVLTSRELPRDVIVEFHPTTNFDWLKVQSISQNPRVRAKLSIQKRLFNLLEFLENKWDISHNKLGSFHLRLKPSRKHELKEVNITRVDFVQGGSMKPHDHMIEIKKLAEGWTRLDESSMTIGELYLAFKCPEKLVLEYKFEQFVFSNSNNPHDQVTSYQPIERVDLPTDCMTVAQEPFKDTLIFKLLTAANLSLAHIERQKLELQHKLYSLPGTRLKRRRGPSNPNTIKHLKRDELQSSDLPVQQPEDGRLDKTRHRTSNNNHTSAINDRGQGQTMTLHDIEVTNQRVEEALKQLQPTRLSVFRRAR